MEKNGDQSGTKCYCGAAKCRGFLEVIETPSTESAQTTNTAVKLSEQKVTGTIVKTAVVPKIGREHHPDDSESSAVESIGSDTKDSSPFQDLEERWIFRCKYLMHVATWCLYQAPWNLETDFTEDDYFKLSSHQKRYACGNKMDRLAYAEWYLVPKYNSENRNPFVNLVLDLRERAMQNLVHTIVELAEYSTIVEDQIGGEPVEPPTLEKITMRVMKENMLTYSIGRVDQDRCDLIACEMKKTLEPTTENT